MWLITFIFYTIFFLLGLALMAWFPTAVYINEGYVVLAPLWFLTLYFGFMIWGWVFDWDCMDN